MEPIDIHQLLTESSCLYAYIPVVKDTSEDYIGDTIHISIELPIGKGHTFKPDGHGNWLISFTDGAQTRTVSLVKAPVYRLDEKAPEKAVVEQLHEEVKSMSGSIMLVDTKIKLQIAE